MGNLSRKGRKLGVRGEKGGRIHRMGRGGRNVVEFFVHFFIGYFYEFVIS